MLRRWCGGGGKSGVTGDIVKATAQATFINFDVNKANASIDFRNGVIDICYFGAESIVHYVYKRFLLRSHFTL